MDRARFCGCQMVAVCLLAAAGCAGHRVASTFAELEPRMKEGQTIYVTSVGGDVRKGRLEKLSTTEARVSISGATVRILEHDALEISVPEPLWQGTLAGGVIGAALGGLAQQTGEAYGCILVSSSHCESGQPVAGYLVGAVLGSAFGAGLDAVLWTRTKVFTAPGGAPARVVLSPVLGRRTGGFQVTATF